MLDFEGCVPATLSVRMNRFPPRVTFFSSSIFLGGTAAYHTDTTPSSSLHACWLLKQVEDRRVPTSSVTPRARTDRPRLVPGVAHSRDLREVERHLSRETPMALSLSFYPYFSLFLSYWFRLHFSPLYANWLVAPGQLGNRAWYTSHKNRHSTSHAPLTRTNPSRPSCNYMSHLLYGFLMFLIVNSDYFLNSINQLICLMVKCGVLFEVRTEFWNI
jgi:hypothetical protein